ncbi:MFS transporter [Thermocatellispora tengchongensis]|uniref:MFS transporter n=1 Tax=Thermocatellispora tengchongensis TaxID=1073253 RepID=UPI00362920F1
MLEFKTDHSSSKAFALLGAVQIALIGGITLIAVPLPAIQRDFGLTQAELALVSAAYGLPFAGLLLLGGRLADRLGPRRVFLAGVALFGLASVAGGLAPGYGVLLTARFAQGAGAALTAPAAVALVTLLHPDPVARGRAFALWGTLSVTGATTGSLAGGLIASATSTWRWTFAVPVAAALAALLRHRVLPAARRGRPPEAWTRSAPPWPPPGWSHSATACSTASHPSPPGRASRSWPPSSWSRAGSRPTPCCPCRSC